jgi:preprotein translocase subunit SecE
LVGIIRKVVNVARKIVDEPSEDIVANARAERAQKRGPFARIALFLRQVMNELKKVITPTRKELISYTAVVLVFVVFMMAIVSLLDLLFGTGVGFIFGNGQTQ